jgi:RNA 2',3'-cyclic 3'-phosphodiesterase
VVIIAASSEPMRIFVAVDLGEEIRSRVATFMESVREFAPEARWVRAESLHVTLKFIGEQSPDQVERLKGTLLAVRSPAFQITFGGFGFFPNSKVGRVFWIGIRAGAELAQLAATVDVMTLDLGVPKEDHPFSPHLTLARGGSGAPSRQKGDGPNRRFQLLCEKLASISELEFGTMTAREFFLFESNLGRGGSRYNKLHCFPLIEG